MDQLTIQLEDDCTWLCRHVDAAGDRAPSTRLRLEETQDWPHPVQNSRRWTRCSGCGTRWRVWVELRSAKPSVGLAGSDDAPVLLPLRRAPVLDIDQLVARVRRDLPHASVTQWEDAWPADDEGIWSFRVPDADREIQVASSTGMCPFFVELDQRLSLADGGGRNATTIEEAGDLISKNLGP